MLANVNLAADMDVAAKFGRIVVIGNRGEITINPRVAMSKDLDIRGLVLWNATAAQVKFMMRATSWLEWRRVRCVRSSGARCGCRKRRRRIALCWSTVSAESLS